MVTQLKTKTLYEQDFCLWAETMADLLKNRQADQLDLQNLIQEIETMGRSLKKSLQSNLEVLLTHLLKWKYQTHKRSSSWEISVREHRRRILEQFRESPSLKRYFDLVFEQAYEQARKQASIETSLHITTFPVSNPFPKEKILEEDFLPE